MKDLKVILLIFVIASIQCYSVCHAEQSIENTRYNRTGRALASSWIFVDPTDQDPDISKISWIAAQITEDVRRERYDDRRFNTNEELKTDDEYELRQSSPLKPSPVGPSSPRQPTFRPAPTRPTSEPTSNRPASERPAPLINDPNPCDRELPKKPNFYRRGRRISEAKCDEFHFDLIYQEEQKKKDKACEKYKTDQGEEDNTIKVAVVGGRLTEPGEFPHMGALGWRAVNGGWKFQCGSTLISEKYLLTAAHCSSASTRDTTIENTMPEIVRLGVTNLHFWPDDINPLDSTIAQIIVHPRYASPSTYFDIAVVELKSALTFVDGFIQPACLWTRDDTTPLGNRAFVSGWGLVDPAATVTASDLQVAEVDLIDSAQCDSLLGRNRNFRGLMSHQLCAGVLRGGIDTCKGDSGGPLQVKIPTGKKMSFIIGVTSFGRGCARANSPGVYTRVSSFIDWIENIVWPG